MAILVCPQCGAKNRVDESRSARHRPVCGRCGAGLQLEQPAGGVPVEVTDDTFARLVLAAGDTPVLLDCWAPWCGPCRMLAPVLEQLAADADGRYTVAKLNTDENPAVAAQLRIDALPTLVIFRNGEVVDRIVGLVERGAIEQRLAAAAR